MREALSKHDFASILRTVRQVIPLTQKEIGEIVGIDQSVVSRIESGKQQVTHFDMLLRFMEGLQIPARFVFPLAALDGRGRSIRELNGTYVTDADEGLRDATWDQLGTVSIMEDWLEYADSLDSDRRIIREIHGSRITRPIRGFTKSLTANLPFDPDMPKVTDSKMDYIDTTIDYLRRVDDMEGGRTNNLAQVQHHFLAVGRWLKAGMASNTNISQRLHNAVAQLAQIASWMCYDADDHGKAQRYFLTALHASRSSNDTDHCAFVMAFQGYQSVYYGQFEAALQLTLTAFSLSSRIHPMVRAQVLCWHGHALAATGHIKAAQTAWDRTLDLYCSPQAHDNPPKWLYWLSEEELTSQVGEALIVLAKSDSKNSRFWLSRANECLEPKAIPNDISYPRSATYNGLWLVRNYIQQNEIERAVDVGMNLLNHDSFVCSPRSTSLLASIDADLARRSAVATMPLVKEFRSRILQSAYHPYKLMSSVTE